MKSAGLTHPPSVEAARVVVGTLLAQGVRDVVIAPGSRSAPFVPVLAAAEAGGALRVRVVLDERSAAFMALGMARAYGGTRRPAVVITTSGTAVANLHPAVAEADAAGVPLLVVSADRPHEFVGTGASQTTEQTRLFGAAARLVVDLPADLLADLGSTAGAAAIAGQVRRLVAAARGTFSDDPGPAQLNIRFRPPLTAAEGVPVGPSPGRLEALAPLPGPQLPTTARPVQAVARRGLIVAGDGPDEAGPVTRALAEHLRWPLLAEPTSGARGGPMALTRYAELLATPAGQELAGQAEHILVVGHPSLSRPVTALLSRTDIPVEVLATTARWTDVAGNAARVLPLPRDPGQVPELVGILGLDSVGSDWVGGWRRAVAALAPLPVPGEKLTAAEVVLAAYRSSVEPEGPGPRLVVASSMTIRYLDRFAPPAVGPGPGVVANRGLAGIDGTLATAVGLSLASGEPTRVVLGDLAFLHDAMSLARGSLETEPDLQAVVVDDRGGAIFSTLEYPQLMAAEVFDRYFTAPQATDIPRLARALGAHVHEPRSRSDLHAILSRPPRGLSVVHVRVHP